MHDSKIEYDKFKDADASYQHCEGYKIVIEPMSSVYIHECPPESPAQGRIGTTWLTEGKRAIRYSLLDVEIVIKCACPRRLAARDFKCKR